MAPASASVKVVPAMDSTVPRYCGDEIAPPTATPCVSQTETI